MNFTYITVINGFVILWCLVAIGLLWGSWDDIGAAAKTAVVFATPCVIWALGSACFWVGVDLNASRTTNFMRVPFIEEE